MVCENSALAWSLLPLKTKFKLFILAILLHAVRRRDGTLNRLLVSLAELKAVPDSSPVDGVRTADYTVDRGRGIGFRLFLPSGRAAQPRAVVVFFHGGGFAFLSAAAREYDAFCRAFCRQLGVAVVSVNYRLTPEHKYPAQYDDGVDILRFLDRTKASRFYVKGLLLEFFQTVDLSHCFLAGDSAGANIAHHVARRWTWGMKYRLRLVGLISIQPFFGGEGRVLSEMRLPHGPLVSTERTDWLWKAFLPDGVTRDHPAASASAAAENLSESFPPVMVMAGELDPLLDWQRKYFRSLRKNGKEAELIEFGEAIHAFYLFPELNRSTELIDEMRSFIVRQTRRLRQGGSLDVTVHAEIAMIRSNVCVCGKVKA